MAEATKNQKRLGDRRQRRIARRKREILTAAARVVARKSYANTTMKEIAEEADIAEGTLYNYFDGKREILMGIVSDTDELMETVLLEGEGLEEREAFIEIVEKGLDISETQIPFLRTLFTEAWLDDEILQGFVDAQLMRIYQRLTVYVTEQVERGVFRAIDPSLATQLVLGMFGSLLLPALRGVAPLPAPRERRALAEAVVDILLDGIYARKI